MHHQSPRGQLFVHEILPGDHGVTLGYPFVNRPWQTDGLLPKRRPRGRRLAS
jgi:hypothetical protein